MNCKRRLDLLMGARLIVELKATDALAPIHIVQVMSKCVVPPLALLASWRFNLPAFTHDADGIEYSWTVYPITRSKGHRASAPLREALRIRMVGKGGAADLYPLCTSHSA